MPQRKFPIVTNEIYHVFNRSIDNTTIFKDINGYQRAVNLIEFYRFNQPPLRFSHFNRLSSDFKKQFIDKLQSSKELVDIYAFCLMPNHFHFLMSQKVDNGISQFISNLQNAYAKYLNTKYQRTGSLFQAMFKLVRIETDEQFIHVQRYIHLNPLTSYILKKFEDLHNYPWNSFGSYTEDHPYDFINTKPTSKIFQNKQDLITFTANQMEYQRQLHQVKDLTLE